MKNKIILLIIILNIFFLGNITLAEEKKYRCFGGGEWLNDAYSSSNCDDSCSSLYVCKLYTAIKEPTSNSSNSGKTVSLTNPINAESIPEVLGKIIQAILGLVGSISLLMVVYGGLLWLTSAGNTEQITKGKNIFIWSTIGLAVIFFSFTILQFIFKALGV